MQRRRDEFWEGVPRGINLAKGLRPWSCSCGQVDNWMCRKRCWKCGRDQPHRLAAEAKRLAASKRDEARRDRSESRGRSRERHPRGQPGAGSKPAHGSYADAAKAARRNEELQKQLAAEKRAREDLEKKLSAATAAAGKQTSSTPEPGKDDDEEDELESKKREQRLQQLSTAIEALEAVVDEADPKLATLRSERDALERAKQAGRPLKAKLLSLERKIEKKKAALEKLGGELAEAWREAEAASKHARELDDKQDELQKAIDALEADRKQMLREELDESSKSGGGDCGDSDTKHWEGTVEAIRARLAVPGVEGSLANAISATLEQLRQQCSLLPAQRPNPKGQQQQPSHQLRQTPSHYDIGDGGGKNGQPRLGSVPNVLGPNGHRGAPSTSSSSARPSHPSSAGSAATGTAAAQPTATMPSATAGTELVAVTAAGAAAAGPPELLALPAGEGNSTAGRDDEGAGGGGAGNADHKLPGGQSDDEELQEMVLSRNDELEDALAGLTPEQSARVRSALESSNERKFITDEGREQGRERERSPRPRKGDQ